jgi:integrase
LREQLDRLVAAIDLRYRALVLVAALTGMRWGELVALPWDDPGFGQPLDDGAVRGPGRLRIAPAVSDPRRTGRWVEKGPKTEAGKRVIALDQETVQALLAHRELVGGGSYDRIFTSPGGSRGLGGTVARDNFHRVWKRALARAELAHLWPGYGGLHFHDLRHTHATWLIAQRVPMLAVAGRFEARQCGGDHDGVCPRRQAGRPRAADGRRAGTGGADAGPGREAGASSG